MNRKPLSEQSQKLLADSLRQKFSRSVAPDILERISDEQLIDHYFANANSKIRLIRDSHEKNGARAGVTCVSPFEAK
jgi:hypothetical protein